MKHAIITDCFLNNKKNKSLILTLEGMGDIAQQQLVY